MENAIINHSTDNKDAAAHIYIKAFPINWVNYSALLIVVHALREGWILNGGNKRTKGIVDKRTNITGCHKTSLCLTHFFRFFLLFQQYWVSVERVDPWRRKLLKSITINHRARAPNQVPGRFQNRIYCQNKIWSARK